MKIPLCRGSKDLLPEEMAKFRRIEAVFRTICLSSGYDEIRTPTLEYLHLFTAAGTLTPNMLNRVYSFLDWDGWSGERVVLRPEGTIPAARLYVDNFQNQGIMKFFYVENTFIFEATGQEDRERWQCGAELLGSNWPEADGELILLALDVLEQLGIGPKEIKLSHAGIVRALLEAAGFKAEEQVKAWDEILDGNLKVLNKIQSQISPLLQLKGTTPAFVDNLKALLTKAAPNTEPDLDHLATIANLLTKRECPYEITVAPDRGFEYYTGVIFSLFVGGQRVGGGGRYDNLIPLIGGGNIPASGFALYMDHLTELLPTEGWSSPFRQRVLLKGSPGVGLQLSFQLASQLRQAGYLAQLDLGYVSPPPHRWLVTVEARDGTAYFRLADALSDQAFQATDSAEVLRILEGSS
ncbi:MAG: histidine--tRNA ligase family protein [Chloroflexi bacterium]|nr:histidine--tRNA ligase family protein [Chloroflexota bacterium]